MPLTKQDILNIPFNRRDFTIGYVPPYIYFSQIISLFSYEAITNDTLRLFTMHNSNNDIFMLSDYCDNLYNESYRLKCQNIFISNKYVVFLTDFQDVQNKNCSRMFGFLYNGSQTVSLIHNIAYDIEIDSTENNKWGIVV